MEMLSENTLQGWLEGYILSGRHGVFVSYEAFFMIIASMVDQYEKFLHQSERIAWRKPLPAMNFVITSSSWRQDHNGFSHQNPGFISSVLNQHSKHVNVYFPPDANSLLVNMTQVLHSTDSINLIVTGKRELPQYLTMPEAEVQMNEGVTVWEWAGHNSATPDVVFAASGDYALQEVLIAMDILKTDLPELNTRLVYVSEISCFGIGDNHVRSRLNLEQFHTLFERDVPILYSYHGYPEDIKMLVFNHPDAPRFHVYGYAEQGTTTTPFDMQVQNGTSRYHLVLEALRYCAKSNPSVQAKMYQLQEKYLDILKRHKEYIVLHGDDMPEVKDYQFNNEPTDN
jgi:xylulose-5-phosphate/fructose-6-phosphate phosphoketolase